MGCSLCKMVDWRQETILEEGSLFRKSTMMIVIEQDVPLYMPTRHVSEVRTFTNAAGGSVTIRLDGEKRMGCICDHPVLDRRINQMLMSMLSDEEYLPFPKMPINPPHLHRQSALTEEMRK